MKVVEEFYQKVMDGLDACITTDCWCCPYNGTEACIMKIKEDALAAISMLKGYKDNKEKE